ncbi:hypothetical protein ACLOJK_032857 [Asimina triloba]
MEEVIDELEPLFDYSRIQPIDFECIDGIPHAHPSTSLSSPLSSSPRDCCCSADDCSVSSPYLSAKRKRVSNPSVMERNAEDCEVVIMDEVEDWLPPPPNKPVGTAGAELEKDPTIQELRLKKQELASFSQSAEDIVRAVEAAVKRELGCSGKSSVETEANLSTKSSLETEVNHPSKESDKRAKIVISIQDKDGVKQFRVFMDEKFERLFKTYSENFGQKIEGLVFCFDGDKVSPTMTPESLGMEDGDIIEVHVKSSKTR